MVAVTPSHDPVREAYELREQLSSHTRRIALLLGAGTSIDAGLDGMEGLTAKVAARLGEERGKIYSRLLDELGERATVEDVLNKVRLFREYLGGDSEREVDGLTHETVNALDEGICRAIIDILSIDPPNGLGSVVTLAEWIRLVDRDHPVEIFTTNYDLLIERGLEESGVAFFDGFVGAVAPFFVPESVEADGLAETKRVYPPVSWARLWKVHGSIGWRLRSSQSQQSIVRMPGRLPQPGEQLLIYPTREKYLESRRLPFMTFFDRFRRFLSAGERNLLILGYSFRDQHINEIIFDALRANNKLAVTALLYSSIPDELMSYGRRFRNMSLLGTEAACVGGLEGDWSEPSRSAKEGDPSPFWDEKGKRFTLGDFGCFAEYLERTVGLRIRRLAREEEGREGEAP